MYCCIPTFTTDSNTRTGMIWVTLNMPSAANRQGIVREFHIVWRVVTLQKKSELCIDVSYGCDVLHSVILTSW